MEDEYVIARKLSAMLEDRSAEVIGPFGNADQALERILRDGFEVAVLDIHLQAPTVTPARTNIRR